ncbi:MAG: histidine phosphatase family protein [Candidatus Pacearchaeota archaeon]
MEILFIRHGEKEKGIENPGITKKGIKQVKYLNKKLKKQKFDELYCSDKLRAKQTAAYVSKVVKLKPKVEESLNEFDGEVIKTPQKHWNKEQKEKYSKLKIFLKSFTEKANSNKRILIVAHGNTNRLILALLLELELKNLIRLQQSETAMNEIYWVERFGNWRLRYWNDTSHLTKKLLGKEKDF